MCHLRRGYKGPFVPLSACLTPSAPLLLLQPNPGPEGLGLKCNPTSVKHLALLLCSFLSAPFSSLSRVSLCAFFCCSLHHGSWETWVKLQPTSTQALFTYCSLLPVDSREATRVSLCLCLTPSTLYLPPPSSAAHTRSPMRVGLKCNSNETLKILIF